MVFQVGQSVTFTREGINAQVTIEKVIESANKKTRYYAIEHADGVLPNEVRIKKYELDANKKYLFADESELTEI